MASTVLLRHGLVSISLMDSEGGLESLSKATEVDPKNADVYRHKGQVVLTPILAVSSTLTPVLTISSTLTPVVASFH